MAQPDYLVIGHLTYDLTPAGRVLGGTAAYAARTAQALGRRVAMVTSTAEDLEPQAHLPGVEILRLPAEYTTTFENIYTPAGRRQFLRGHASRLGAAAVPLEWRRVPLVHLGPVANEIEPDLAAQFPQALIGLTLQGWLRAWDPEGRVRPMLWPGAESALSRAHAAVLGREDLPAEQVDTVLASYAQVTPVLAVTDGAAGSTVYWRGEARHFPAPTVTEVDPTGAGDIYATCFFVRLAEGGNPWEAARFATCLAARSVTRPGLASVPATAEIAACR